MSGASIYLPMISKWYVEGLGFGEEIQEKNISLRIFLFQTTHVFHHSSVCFRGKRSHTFFLVSNDKAFCVCSSSQNYGLPHHQKCERRDCWETYALTHTFIAPDTEKYSSIYFFLSGARSRINVIVSFFKISMMRLNVCVFVLELNVLKGVHVCVLFDIGEEKEKK